MSTLGSSFGGGLTLGAKRLQLPATPFSCFLFALKLLPASRDVPPPGGRDGDYSPWLPNPLKLLGTGLSAQIGKASGQFPLEMSGICV